jgi:hypothetical protein
MKVLKTIFIIVVFFLLGYIVGNLYPLGILSVIRSFVGPSGNISGDVELKVTVLDEKKNPIPNLEVDLDKNVPPSPARILFVDTDENGVATFQLKPGTYFVFFNTNNFPNDFRIPRAQKIDVKSGKANELTIILKRK